MAGMIRIKRRPYIRKGGIRVRGTTYLMRDRGKKGRGRKIIKIKSPGSLGGKGFFAKPLREQKKILKEAVRKYGERSVLGKLQAIVVFNKRTNPKISKEASRLRKLVAKYCEGRTCYL